MASAPQTERFTPEQYLQLEVQSDRRHEYYRGEIFLMTGASRAHYLIAANIIGRLNRHLAGNPCEVYGADMRVKVSESGLYTYPDISVACPSIEFEMRQGTDTLLNPVVIIEVLSPTTEAYDRGRKLAHYQKLPSLREYILVSQDEPRIDHLERLAGGDWRLSIAAGLEASVRLNAIDCQLRLIEVYDKLEFPPFTQEPLDGPAS